MKEYLTVLEVAKLCKVTVPGVHKWLKKGLIKFYRSTPGGDERKGRCNIRKEDLIEFLKDKKAIIPPELFKNEYRILIIEDREGPIEAIKLVIELLAEKIDDKFRVEVARDGVEAGMKISQFRPHLITLDCLLPKIDGDVVLENLKKNDEYKNIKVIAITAHDKYIPALKRLKADATLMKPFNNDDLERLICRFLKLKPFLKNNLNT